MDTMFPEIYYQKLLTPGETGFVCAETDEPMGDFWLFREFIWI